VFSTGSALRVAVNEYLSDKDAGMQLYGRMNCWDVSTITDMNSLFYGRTTVNEDIRCWDVSNVTNMDLMFYAASSFNQDIGKWDVSKVFTMAYMFYAASSFNQDIGKWNVSSVSNMYYLFHSASSFNHNLCDWFKSFSSGTPQSYSYMFSYSGCSLKFELNFDLRGHFCQKCMPLVEISGKRFF
jgi:surface protein